MRPQISVLISTYNNRALVEKKLAEILRQTFFSQAEFIFIETASPTRERELLEPFCRKYPNCRLIALDERKTLYDAWNIGWDAAQSPLLCYSNMDDVMHPRLLEFLVRHMNEKQWDICSVLIGKQQLGADSDDWSADRIARLRLANNPGPFTAWRASLKERIGQFDDQLAIVGDRDFWARVSHHRLKFGIVPGILYLYSKSEDQLSKSPKYRTLYNRDLELTAQKSYPSAFPANWKRKLAGFKFARALFPKKYLVPCP
ncbi:MAG TPA: glycosyltransferase [Verrucomicrobiae bacterium]|nr:glycosyltransferase [Verrucomicrobiae bacterium]